MRLGFAYVALSTIFGLLLLSSVVVAQTNSIVFPDVEAWEKGDKTTYPTAELGYSVPYQSETGGSVTIYVYNGGLGKIADGIDDQKVKNEIRKAEDDIKKYGDAGYYQDVKLIKSESAKLGGKNGIARALYSLFNFKIRGAEVESEIYLFGYKNNFIKIRTTRKKGNNGAENAEVNKLLLEIGKQFVQ